MKTTEIGLMAITKPRSGVALSRLIYGRVDSDMDDTNVRAAAVEEVWRSGTLTSSAKPVVGGQWVAERKQMLRKYDVETRAPSIVQDLISRSDRPAPAHLEPRKRRIVFTDEKMFTLGAPRNAQNEWVYGDGRKRTKARERPVVPRAHFCRKLMVSGRILWNGTTHLHLILENEQITTAALTFTQEGNYYISL
uniref:Transposase n=1 Tax=Plectus sambesii TaxID=2011161 RepID=A0A914WGY7_9BILA